MGIGKEKRNERLKLRVRSGLRVCREHGYHAHCTLPSTSERFFVFHDIGQYSTTNENHVFTARRIFNTNFEFLFKKR